MRRRQRETAHNQKQEEASKRPWGAHRSSVSSHSSGDEVRLHTATVTVMQDGTVKTDVDVLVLLLL